MSSRKGAQQTAMMLIKDCRMVRDAAHREALTFVANGLKDNKLRGKIDYYKVCF